MSCSSGCAKIILFIFNFCFFLFGAASLGVGIWVLVDKSSLLQLAKTNLPNTSSAQDLNSYLQTPSLLQVGAYVLIAIGAFTFVVGFCGCCGAIKESKCLLYIYVTFVAFILLIEIAGAIVVGVYKGNVESQLKSSIGNMINQYYIGIPTSSDNSPSAVFSNAWNYAQVFFKCCGINNYTDFTTSTWYKSYRNYTVNSMTYQAQIPQTCCQFTDPNGVLSNADNWNKLPSLMVDNQCPITQNKFNNVGCIDGIQNFIKTYSTVLIAVACGIAGLELVGIIAACCLIRSLKEEKY